MNITDIANYSAEQIIYLATILCSAVVCVVFGVLLMLVRRYRFNRRSPFYPVRYITARRILGFAYIFIGVMKIFQIVTAEAIAVPNQSEFLPIAGLIISTSQALLFTAALLALYNSRLVTYSDIFWTGIFPIVWFVVMYVVTHRTEPESAYSIKWMFFGFYMLQLVGYTIAFFVERRQYRLRIEEYFNDDGYNAYPQPGTGVLFLCSLAVGLAALVSYFATELWHLTVFTATYTAYYVAVAVYFLKSWKQSQRITDMTTPEIPDSPERLKYREEYKRQL
jgi:hypothetical protein